MKIGIDVQTTLGQKSGFGFYIFCEEAKNSVPRRRGTIFCKEAKNSAKPRLDEEKQ